MQRLVVNEEKLIYRRRVKGGIKLRMLRTRWTLKVGIGGLFYLLAALLYPFEMVFRY